MQSGRDVIELSWKILGLVGGALGGLVVLVSGYLIASNIQIRDIASRIEAQLPLFQERIERIENRQISRMEQIERRLRVLEDYHRGRPNE